MIAPTKPLPLENGRLVLHFMATKVGPNGSIVTTRRESSRNSFYLIDGGRELAFAYYMRAPFTGKPAMVLILKRAAGPSLQLAAELRGWTANVAINDDLDALAQAIEQYRRRFGGYPTRASLMPGGAFWKWKEAPHLKNALTGWPMILRNAAGDFSYATSNNGGTSYKITVHLYGGFVNSQSEWSAH